MPITRIQAKDFELREELEKEIVRLTGNGVDSKPDFLISGKRDELKRLKLSDLTTVYGVKCEITDGALPPKLKNKEDRGAIFPHGINLIKNKNE